MNHKKQLARQRARETVSGRQTESTNALNQAKEKIDELDKQKEGQCGHSIGKRRTVRTKVKKKSHNSEYTGHFMGILGTLGALEHHHLGLRGSVQAELTRPFGSNHRWFKLIEEKHSGG